MTQVKKFKPISKLAVSAIASMMVSVPAYADPGGLLQRKNPTVKYKEGVHFAVAVNPVPVGDVTATVTTVAVGAVDSGCDQSDFAGFPQGDIALVSRGTCLFAIKVQNAAEAGASGLLIANSAAGLNVPNLGGTNAGIPVLLITQMLGANFAEQANAGTLTVRMKVKIPKLE